MSAVIVQVGRIDVVDIDGPINLGLVLEFHSVDDLRAALAAKSVAFMWPVELERALESSK